MKDKNTLRKICLNKRNALSKQERDTFSKQICLFLEPFLENKTILSYYPIGSEVDLTLINERHEVSYPRILNQRHMEAYYPQQKRFILGQYSIPEPDPFFSVFIKKEELDVILIPCVGFDEKRGRLGHGGGYYDSYLQNYKGLKIGLGFEAQKVFAVPMEEYDIRPDLIISEKKIYF